MTIPKTPCLWAFREMLAKKTGVSGSEKSDGFTRSVGKIAGKLHHFPSIFAQTGGFVQDFYC
jgi:hypothetical protein